MLPKEIKETDVTNIQVQSLFYNGAVKTTWSANRIIQNDSQCLVLETDAPLRFTNKGQTSEFPYRVRQYFFTDKWFNVFAFFEPDGRLSRWYCNVASPLNFDGGKVTFTDFDVDILILPGQEQQVLDRDEFEEHKIKFSYPQDVIDKVEVAILELTDLIATNGYPFNQFSFIL